MARLVPAALCLALLARPAAAGKAADASQLCMEGSDLAKAGDFEAAYQKLRQSAVLWLHQPACLGNLEYAAYKTQRWQDVIDAGYQVIRLTPDADPSRYSWLADALAITGRHDEAAQVYHDGFEHNPSADGLWQGEVVALYAAGRDQEAGRLTEVHGSNFKYAYELILQALRRWAVAADDRHLIYGRIFNHAALYRILGWSREGTYLDEQRQHPWLCQDVNGRRMDELVTVYNVYWRAPFKPGPSARSLELIAQAEENSAAGDWETASRKYVRALEYSPWSPALAFDVGLARIVANHEYSDSFNQSAVYDFQLYKDLDPQGSRVKDAEYFIKKYGKGSKKFSGVHTTAFTDVCELSYWGID